MLLAQSYIIKQSPAGLYIFFESSLSPRARPEAYKDLNKHYITQVKKRTGSVLAFGLRSRSAAFQTLNPDAPSKKKSTRLTWFLHLVKRHGGREPPLEYLLFPASTSRHGARPRRGVTSDVYTDMIGSSRFRRTAWRNTS